MPHLTETWAKKLPETRWADLGDQ